MSKNESYQNFLVRIAKEVDSLLIENSSTVSRFRQHLQNFAKKENKHLKWLNEKKERCFKEGKTFSISSNMKVPPEYQSAGRMFVINGATKKYPAPKNKEEEYQRCYIILASIHDQILTQVEKIDNSILPEQSALLIWSTLHELWDSSPNRAFIDAALERVKADLTEKAESLEETGKETNPAKEPEKAEQEKMGKRITMEKHEAFESSLREIATQVDNIILDKNAKSLFQKHIDNVFREAENYRKYLHAEYVKASEKMMEELYDSKPRDCYDWFSKSKENTLKCFMDHVDLDFSSEVHSWMEEQPKLDPLGYVYDMARGGTTYRQHDNLILLDYQYFILACIHDCQRYEAGQTPIYFNPKAFDLRLHEPCDLKNGSCGKTYTLIADLSYRDFAHKVQPTIQIALQAVQADCTRNEDGQQKPAGTGHDYAIPKQAERAERIEIMKRIERIKTKLPPIDPFEAFLQKPTKNMTLLETACIWELALHALSIVIFAHKNDLSDDKKSEINIFFSALCQQVLWVIQGRIDRAQCDDIQFKANILSRYHDWADELMGAFGDFFFAQDFDGVKAGKVFAGLSQKQAHLCDVSELITKKTPPTKAEADCKKNKDGRKTKSRKPAESEQKENGAQDKQAEQNKPEARHSIDFRSVHWFGTDYSFTPNQAAAVKILWEAWENKTPDVGGDTLAVEIESDSRRARDIFKGHSAFGIMICQGRTKGTYRLVEPEKY